MIKKPKRIEMRVWIDIASASPEDVHELQNLGEDLWKDLREEPRASINLDEVDVATDRLVIYLHSASKSNLRWLETFIAKKLNRYKNFQGRVILRPELIEPSASLS